MDKCNRKGRLILPFLFYYIDNFILKYDSIRGGFIFMKQLVTPIDYDKLSDDLYWLGNKIVVRFNVVLAKQKETDQSRIFHHKEFLYPSKYSDKDRVITMRRSFQYYISIDKIDMYDAGVMIRVQDIMLVRAKLHEASMWFTNGTFAEKKKKLIIPSRPNSITITGLTGGKYIMMDPIVIEYEDSNLQQQGIRLTISDQDIYTDMSIDKFYGLCYLMNSINMYQSAQLLINYLGRPELGTNLYEFNNRDYPVDEMEEPEPTAKNRDILHKQKQKSFFDRINEED